MRRVLGLAVGCLGLVLLGARGQPGDQSAQALLVLKGHTDKVTCVAVSPDGKRALSGSDDKTVRLWDLATGRELRLLRGHDNWVLCVAFAPDGRHAFSGGGGAVKGNRLLPGTDRVVRLWDLETATVVRRFEGHADKVWALAVGPDGKRLATAGTEKAVRLWDVASGKELRRFGGHKGTVRSLAFSGDGRRLLSSDQDGVRLWDVENGKQLRFLNCAPEYVKAVAFSPDGRVAYAAGVTNRGNGKDSAVHAWEVGGKPLAHWKMPAEQVWALAVSPSGRRLLIGGRKLGLWDAAEGQPLATLAGHGDEIRGVAFAGDGRRAVAGGHDRTLRVWELPR